jgi:transposase
VLCVDEKTGMQALGRKHEGRAVAPGRDARMDYEYIRNGTRKLLAVFNPHTGDVYAEVREERKAQDLLQFMNEVAKRYPKQQVHIIWDNLNIHFDGPDKRWTEFNARHAGRFHFHYTPLHASWVNQVELLFGIVHRRVLRYGVFNCLEELDEAVIAFLDHWNVYEAHPFNWTFKGYPLQIGAEAA